MSAATSRGGKGRAARVAGVIVLALLLLVLLLAAAAWLNRRLIAREALVGWLERQGVPAEVEVERIELNGVVGSIRVGDPRNPDLAVEKVEVDYAVVWPWSSGGAGVTPSRVRLIRPVLRARWTGERLSFGALDPLIEDFRRRPPRPDAAAPLVLIEGGRLRLMTEQGVLEINADAHVADGRLRSVDASLPVQDFSAGDLGIEALEGGLSLITNGDRVRVDGRASAQAFALDGVTGAAAAARLTGVLPYPDPVKRAADGPAELRLAGEAGVFRIGQTRLTRARLEGLLRGELRGWLDQAAFRGRLSLDGEAATARTPGFNGGDLRLRTSSATIEGVIGDKPSWRLEGPARLTAGRGAAFGLDGRGVAASGPRIVAGGRGRAWEASGRLNAEADRLDWGGLSLKGAKGTLDLDLVQDSGLRVKLAGDIAAPSAAWPLLGAPARGDLPELTEMKRALADFSLTVPSLRLVADEGATTVRLGAPVVAAPGNGGRLTVAASSAVFDSRLGQRGGGALTLAATRGAGLPELAVAVPEWRLTEDGFQARLDGRASLDFGLGRGVAVRAAGLLASGGGGLAFRPSGCSPVSVERLELGANDVFDLSGALCPQSGNLIVVRDGGWRVEGRLRDAAARAPFLQMRFDGVTGPLTAAGGPRGVSLDVRAEAARAIDTAEPARFNPVAATGRASLAGDRWTGAFDLARSGSALGRLTLAHDGRSGAGGMDIRSDELVFSPAGLQPADLSPLAGRWVGSPASGRVRFRGRFDWTATGGSSSGLLTVPSLDFQSPAGAVTGLTGEVAFTSLSPLITAPGQSLTAASVAGVAPLSDIRVGFELEEQALAVAGGEVALAGGRARLEPFRLPLDPQAPWSGVLVLDRVQINELLKTSDVGERVRLDALVSGRLPFTFTPGQGIRVAGGQLTAVQPGRLEIEREALSGLSAGGGGEAPPNVVQDLAYQAMEDLAFETLSAEVNSLEQGRLGVLFRIKGRFDPPERQTLRIGVREFLDRSYLNRLLPLPSGTEVDLTLDTTLNVDQLVSDLLAVNRARSGGRP